MKSCAQFEVHYTRSEVKRVGGRDGKGRDELVHSGKC